VPIPKSDYLAQLESSTPNDEPNPIEKHLAADCPHQSVTIKPVKCHNNYVAILLSQIESSIQLVNSDGQYKNEGFVIGVGPGISDGSGGRLPLTVSVGDYVMIGTKNHVAILTPDDGPYKGRKVVIVAENNVICDIPTDIEPQIEQ
jgi:co-chaperonin GroES (HSP10)